MAGARGPCRCGHIKDFEMERLPWRDSWRGGGSDACGQLPAVSEAGRQGTHAPSSLQQACGLRTPSLSPGDLCRTPNFQNSVAVCYLQSLNW